MDITMKLKAGITSNSVKLIDIYNKIISGALVTNPDFQRKLVWKKQHKYAFIKTILLNFPFPEVYIASSEVDIESLQAKEMVVDGQQRLTTIVDYIKGTGDFIAQNQIPSFDDLSIDDKKEFLNYSITVKDLKDIGIDKIKEVFKRINSTDYSLNSNEILNAEYGDGEFSMFCKQIIDDKFKPTIELTDIILDDDIRSKFINFFSSKSVFSDNDNKRMFNLQYIMLLAVTILEGNYFSRSTRIESYLEKYNEKFDEYIKVIEGLENSINIINKLNLPSQSYWFNKANLFTLLIELQNINSSNINLEILELELLELERKVDIYFSDEEDISMITDDERKYFENARQGSHELAARQHRGKIISEIIKRSQTTNDKIESKSTSNIIKNKEFLEGKECMYSIIIPTETGLRKSIMDATSGIRVFLNNIGLHDYESQEYGSENKKIIKSQFIYPTEIKDTDISLYRSNGRGDFRIWIKDLKGFANANEELAILYYKKEIKILNLSKHDYSTILSLD